jgi:hypothetical protein
MPTNSVWNITYRNKKYDDGAQIWVTCDKFNVPKICT